MFASSIGVKGKAATGSSVYGEGAGVVDTKLVQAYSQTMLGLGKA